jgi:uncharacterized protein YdhG (YjbR/CyaY superfamily)
MPRSDFKSVAEYIRAQPKAVQPVLRQVRAIIRKAVPEAVEVISYQMPAYRIPEGPLLGLAAWREHYSIYPASDELVAAFKGQLTRYRTSKGTLRFSLSEPVPAKLIERVARFRARQVVRRARAKRLRTRPGR